jgi:glutamate-1-semialdehyde 2,1-aminomutase
MPAGDTRIATLYRPYPTYMVKGAGAYLYDGDGNRYFDLLNNYTSLIHGHAQPTIVENSADQLTRGTVFGSAATPQIELARLLIERIPSFERMRFTNSGTEATMMMMRAARAFTGKDVIIKIDGGYHGSHDFAEVNVSPDLESASPTSKVEGRGIPQAVLNAVLVVPFNDLNAMEAMLQQHHEQVAAIIVEPMPNAGGMVPPAAGYLRGLRELADKYGVLLLFDEIVTFRLSRAGMQLIEGVKPDLTAIGKIMGGGFPVGAFGGRQDIMDQFNPLVHQDFVQHTGTFNGNNMTMTAGIAAMQCYEQDAIDRINSLGNRLQAGINGAFRTAGIRGQAIGYGSLLQIHWTDQALHTPRDARLAAVGIGKVRELLHLELLNHGVYIGPRGLVNVSTPTQTSDIDFAVATITAALHTLKPYVSEAVPQLLLS